MSKFIRIWTARLGQHLWLRLAVIFFTALVCRLAAVIWIGMTDLVQGSESGIIAANLVAGRGYTFDFYGYRPDARLRSYMPPLYTLLLAFCLRFGPDPGLLLGLVQSLLGSLTAAFICLTAERTASTRVGLMAGLATALYPPLVIQTARPFSMTLHGTLMSGLILLALNLLRSPSLLQGVGVGLSIGLLTLSRTSMLGLIGVVLAWLWLNRQSVLKWRQIAWVIVATAVLTVSPWALRNYAIHGWPLLSTNGGHTFWNGNNPFTTGSSLDVYVEKVNTYLGLNLEPKLGNADIIELRPYPLPVEVRSRVEQLSEVELDAALYAAGFAFIRGNPGDWFRLLLRKFVSFWWFRPNLGRSSPIPGGQSPYYDPRWIAPYQGLYVVVVTLSTVGFAHSLRSWRTFALFYLMFSYLTLVYMLFNVITRYRWEIEQFLVMFAMMGLVSLVREYTSR